MTAVLVCLMLLVPATVACLYYLVLTTVGWRCGRAIPRSEPAHTFAVVIPAHNEELGLTATVRSVLASDYPADRLRVLVVADNCTDGTAAVARRLGVDVIERHDPANRGKGYALAMAIPQALAAGADAVMVLDADCELGRDTLRQMDAALAHDGAVQAARIPRNPDAGPAAVVQAVGSAIENAVSAGRCRLGGSAALRGSGMAFTRAVLERHPWAHYGLTEDAEYAAELARGGVRVRFLPDAAVRGEVPAEVSALARQRKRWRAALYGSGPGLFGRWLASKPLVLAQMVLTVMAVGVLAAWLPAGFLLWAAALIGLTAVVYLRAVRRAGVG
ncbi:MAG TPA: glycosyltransferase family 2 protein, partial [Fimbriiglobus sp.]|nr:glycosyltransferase family 2 protein [Fimbriiglobus sp.]